MKIIKSLMTFLMLLALSGIAFGQTYTAEHRGGSSMPAAGAIDFSGSGQDDINVTGVYEGTADRCYEVQATATGTYKWRASCNFGGYTTGVTMSTTATELESGIKVDWDTATGHTSTDSWKFNVSAINPFRIKNSLGEDAFRIDNDEDITFFSGQISSQNAFLGLAVADAVGTTYVKLNRSKIESHSTYYEMLASDSGKHFVTESIAVQYVLPTASVGLWFKFSVGASGGDIKVTENGGDTIACGGSTAGANITAPTAYDSIILEALDATTWICSSPIPTVGDWTFNN